MAEVRGDAAEEALRKEFDQIVQTLVGHAQHAAADTVQTLTADLAPAAANLRETARSAEVALQNARKSSDQHNELQQELHQIRKTLQTLVDRVNDARAQLAFQGTALGELDARTQKQAAEQATRWTETTGHITTLLGWVLGLLGGGIVAAILFFANGR